jgi:glycosyltransferase involved in cell wall biosynthesis
MRLLFYADGRSPIAANWLRYWIQRGDEIHLVSSFPCNPPDGLASFAVVPVAFSGAKKGESQSRQRKGFLWGASMLRLRLLLRQWLGPFTLPKSAKVLGDIAKRVRPDLVHALRIPFEGMTAAAAGLDVPLVISIWGNDFTMHARSSPLMAYWTRRAVKSCQALHTDCQRDLRIAHQWGFDEGKPGLVIPGNGGIDSQIFHPPAELVDAPVVINPRGFRGYVRNDTFFEAIPLVVKKRLDARFVCSSMAGDPQAEAWIRKLDISHAVELLPPRPHAEMANLFRSTAVMVSPSTHDGTPNSLLEAMACGCFPIVGNVESLWEWITPGTNGQIVDAGDPQALADAILNALENNNLRVQAARENSRIIAERADYSICMAQAKDFYRQVIKGQLFVA